MRNPWPACLFGVTLLSISEGVPVLADGVPLPRPAPFAKAEVLTASPPMTPSRAGQTIVDSVRSLAATVAGSGGTVAFDSRQRVLVEKVNAYLTGVRTLVGDFVQIAPDGGRSRGKFYLQKPGRLRFDYDPPSRVELIADGQSLAVRDRKLATQDIYPLSQTPLRFLLEDRIDLRRTDLVGVYADSMFVSVVIEQKQIFGGTHRLRLMFGANDFRLRQWTIADEQGSGTTVAVYNLNAGKKLDPELFKIN
jgi:outer membrane lipoprotein-sorting protein